MSLFSRLKRLWELSGTLETQRFHAAPELFTTNDDGGIVPLVVKPFRPATVLPDDPIEVFPPETPEPTDVKETDAETR